MRLDIGTAHDRFAGAPLAHLATVTQALRPHIVPIVFAVDGDVIVTAVDAKPKSSTALQRLANIAANPAVSVLVDHYDSDWTQLWWVRADGVARIVSDSDAAAGIRLLAERYPQYRAQPPPGPVITIEVTRWTGWRA